METGWVLFSLKRFAPELVLVAGILLAVVADLVPRFRRGPVAGLSLLAALASLVATWYSWHVGAPAAETFLGALAFDNYSLFFKALFLVATMVVILFSAPVVRDWKTGHGEFFALLLSCTFGMMLMAGANDLLMMYLALEFVSITSYVLAGLLRRNRKSAEASLKYIIYGAAASGLMIYGLSFLYGITGTLEVTELSARLADLQAAGQAPPTTFFLIMSVLIMAGFGYKIAAVPFHMWCPDVYEGAPTPVTAYFSVGPKAAGFAMLARFLMGTFGTEGTYPFEWTIVVAVLCVMTMALGNFAALHQQNLKRLLAYSSIAHAGYILLAFTVFTKTSTPAAMFYLAAYVLMNLGAFLVVIVLEVQYGVETVEGCRGVGWRAPALCGMMVVFLLSLTGIPPTAGFWGKLYVFAEMIQTQRTLPVTLVVIAVVFTVISLYYYMRILAAMFLVKPREGAAEIPVRPIFLALLAVLTAATIFFGLFPNTLLGAAREAWGPGGFLGLR